MANKNPHMLNMRAKTQMMKKLLLLAMPNRLFKRVSKSNNKFYNKKIISR